jgi:hypothetical protein
MADVAGALARAGHYRQADRTAAQAEAVALSIPNEDYRPYEGYQVRSMADAAVRLAHAGQGRPAARVAAALCTIGIWAVAVKPVLLLAPAAFTALTHALAEQQPADSV